MEYEVHPLAELFPLMDDETFQSLVADMKANGQRDPIDLWEGKIIDGRNRYFACKKLGITPNVRNHYIPGDPLDYVVSKNLHRRHLNEAQRAMVATKIANMKSGTRTDLGPIGPRSNRAQVSVSDAAKMLNVSERSVKRANVVQLRGAPQLRQAVEHGAVSLNAAAAVAYLPEEEQCAIVSQGPEAVTQAAKSVIAERKHFPAVAVSSNEARRLTKADAEVMAERIASGESKADIGKDYGLNARGVNALVSGLRGNSHINIPEGTTIESQVRKGMALEADGYSADDAAKEVSIGIQSYRRVREVIVLVDEIDLRPDDRSFVARVLGNINETKSLNGHEAIDPLIERVWGNNGYHTLAAARKRLDHFDTVIGNAVQACEILSTFEIPYLPAAKAQNWLKEAKDAYRSLGAFIKRLEEENK